MNSNNEYNLRIDVKAELLAGINKDKKILKTIEMLDQDLKKSFEENKHIYDDLNSIQGKFNFYEKNFGNLVEKCSCDNQTRDRFGMSIINNCYKCSNTGYIRKQEKNPFSDLIKALQSNGKKSFTKNQILNLINNL